MSRTKTKNTLHSYDRAAERAGLSRAEALRLMKIASSYRKPIEALPPGPIRDFLQRKAATGKRIKLVEGYVFVFCKTSTRCLTMYPLDQNVIKAQFYYDNSDYLIGYCPDCKKYFLYSTYRQTPGFRDTADLYCPYCSKSIKQSMTWEYISMPLE